MIKIILCSAFALIFFFSSALASHSIEELVAHGEKCGGSLADLKNLALYGVSDSPTGKCMLTCMLKDIGIIDKSQKYSSSNMKNFLKYKWSEQSETDSIKIADDCDIRLKDYKNEDQCEYGYEVVHCFAEQMRQKNYFGPLQEDSNKLLEKLNSGTYQTSDQVKINLQQDLEKYKQYV